MILYLILILHFIQSIVISAPVLSTEDSENPIRSLLKDLGIEHDLSSIFWLLPIGCSILVGIAILFFCVFKEESKELNFGSIRLISVKYVGSYGSHWRALHKSKFVMAKSLPLAEEKAWRNEIEFYSLPYTDHPNIAPFIGFSNRRWSFRNTYWLLTSYEKGPLNLYLHENVITVNELMKIIDSIAKGLMFLHNEIKGRRGRVGKPTVAHRDINSRIIMLKDDFTATISGFTKSIIFYPDQPNVRTCLKYGCVNYLAPEILRGGTTFTREGFLSIDMHAFAMVSWELLSRCPIENYEPGPYKIPFELETGKTPSMAKVKEQVATYFIRPILRHSWRRHPTLSVVCGITKGCWRGNPKARLTASDVVELLSTVPHEP